MSEQLHSLIHAIEAHTDKTARKSGKGYRLACPAHNGKDFNLYVADGDKRLVIKCHSHQCDSKDVAESVGLSLVDFYYKRLTGSQLEQYRNKTNDWQIKKELEQELLILLFWICDFWAEFWPRNEKADSPRVALAMKRVNAATKHFIREGIQ